MHLHLTIINTQQGHTANLQIANLVRYQLKANDRGQDLPAVYYQPFNVRFREFRNFSFFLYTNQNRLTDTHPSPCDTGGMDEDQELLNQLMLGMSPEIRQRMQKFIRLVADRDECALGIIRRIEAGRIAPTDALDALDACLGAKH